MVGFSKVQYCLVLCHGMKFNYCWCFSFFHIPLKVNSENHCLGFMAKERIRFQLQHKQVMKSKKQNKNETGKPINEWNLKGNLMIHIEVIVLFYELLIGNKLGKSDVDALFLVWLMEGHPFIESLQNGRRGCFLDLCMYTPKLVLLVLLHRFLGFCF